MVSDQAARPIANLVTHGLTKSQGAQTTPKALREAVPSALIQCPQQVIDDERIQHRPGFRLRPPGDRLGIRQRDLPVSAGHREDSLLSVVEPHAESRLQLPLFVAEQLLAQEAKLERLSCLVLTAHVPETSSSRDGPHAGCRACSLSRLRRTRDDRGFRRAGRRIHTLGTAGVKGHHGRTE